MQNNIYNVDQLHALNDIEQLAGDSDNISLKEEFFNKVRILNRYLPVLFRFFPADEAAELRMMKLAAKADKLLNDCLGYACQFLPEPEPQVEPAWLRDLNRLARDYLPSAAWVN